MTNVKAKRSSQVSRKQMLLLGGIVGGVLAISIGASALLQKDKTPQTGQGPAKPATRTLQVAGNENERDAWRTQSGAELTEMNNRMREMLNRVDGAEKENKELRDKVQQLEQKGAAAPTNSSSSLGQAGAVPPPSMPPGMNGKDSPFSQVGTGTTPPPPIRPDGTTAQPGARGMSGTTKGSIGPGSRIRSIGAEDEPEPVKTVAAGQTSATPIPGANTTNSTNKFSRDTKDKAGGSDGKERFADDDPLSYNRAGGRSAETYLPTGTTMRVVLLNGLDAPTGGQNQQNPMPVSMMVDAPAQLPNSVKANLKGCFVTGNGHGDLSSERAFIRLDRLSCVDEDGGAIDVAIKGYVSGEDGKTGLRGKLISKTGQVLANAILVGTLGGFGEGLRQSATQTNNFGMLGQTEQVQNPWKYGMGSGVGKAMDRVAQYYIKLADKLFPVVEIDGGRVVDVVLTRGVTIERQ